jgi:hypothetical protein
MHDLLRCLARRERTGSRVPTPDLKRSPPVILLHGIVASDTVISKPNEFHGEATPAQLVAPSALGADNPNHHGSGHARRRADAPRPSAERDAHGAIVRRHARFYQTALRGGVGLPAHKTVATGAFSDGRICAKYQTLRQADLFEIESLAPQFMIVCPPQTKSSAPFHFTDGLIFRVALDPQSAKSLHIFHCRVVSRVLLF